MSWLNKPKSVIWLWCDRIGQEKSYDYYEVEMAKRNLSTITWLNHPRIMPQPQHNWTSQNVTFYNDVIESTKKHILTMKRLNDQKTFFDNDIIVIAKRHPLTSSWSKKHISRMVRSNKIRSIIRRWRNWINQETSFDHDIVESTKKHPSITMWLNWPRKILRLLWGQNDEKASFDNDVVESSKNRSSTTTQLN